MSRETAENAPTSLEMVRRLAGIDYATFADRAGGGLTADEVEHYLMARRLPDAATRQRLEQAFGVQLQMDLAAWRQAAGLSLAELGELAACSAEMLGRLERGEWFGPEGSELLSWLVTLSDNAICRFRCHQVRTRYLQSLGPVVIPEMAA